MGHRLGNMLARLEATIDLPSQTTSLDPSQEALSRFHHITTPTLPHLLALLAHPSPGFPPADTRLIVVDSISSLYSSAFVKGPDNRDQGQIPSKKNDGFPWVSSRQWAIMGDLVSRLGKLAAIKNVSILLTSQTTTRLKAESGPVLQPTITGTAWENGVHCRILLFQDWLSSSDDNGIDANRVMSFRFASLIKARGVSHDDLGKIVPFLITKVKNIGRSLAHC